MSSVTMDEGAGTPVTQTPTPSALCSEGAPSPLTHSGMQQVEDAAATLPTPANSTQSSEGASSPLTYGNFPARTKDAKDAHFKRGQIFTKTRQMMRCRTNNMVVAASRGHQRAGYLPTKPTRPPLYKRRYTTDILTKSVDDQSDNRWNEESSTEGITRGPTYNENEPVVQHVPAMSLPNACRFPSVSLRLPQKVPFNNEICLELGDATIRNDAYWFIRVTDDSYGNEAWMRGESLDMALETLRRDHNCDAYSIDMANSNVAQVFYFAAMSKDGSAREYDEYRARFHDKRWVFIVVNNAFGEVVNDGTKGSHWSLVAMDRGGKTLHYYDSLPGRSLSNQWSIGRDVGAGLLFILGENLDDWKFEVEEHSPNQNINNLFQTDVGPCGPFVYTMTGILISHIKSYQDEGRESECFLNLPAGFDVWFGNMFHSQQVRYDIQDAILRWRSRFDAERFEHEHDQAAVRDEDVVLVDDPPTICDTPSLPIHTARREAGSDNNQSRHKRLKSYQDDTNHRDDTAGWDNDFLIGDMSDSGLSTAPSSPVECIELDSSDPDSGVETGADIDHHQDGDLVRDENLGDLEESVSTNNDLADDTAKAAEDQDDQFPAVTRLV
ncbi:Nn.00g024990.m01.CDS01 [Neocucurbitaria sp. VM-36]